MKTNFPKSISLAIAAIFISLSFNSCCFFDDDDDDVEKVYCVEYEECPISIGGLSLKVIPAAAITTAINNIMESDTANAEVYNSLKSKMVYNVKIYKVTYKTTFQGDTIEASGVISVPSTIDKKGKYPMMSFQHGTIFQNSEAPSVNPTESTNLLMSLMASSGMIVLLPDYIGYGESSQYRHPYLHKQYTVNAVLDFIRAGKEFIASEKPAGWDGSLFLAGYSQGGGATLAALSAIENDDANSDIKVTASSCGAGPYNLNIFREWLVEQNLNGDKRYDKPSFLVYMINTFVDYSNVTTPYSAVFNGDYASIAPTAVDGTKSIAEVDAMFSKSIPELMNPEFLDDATYSSSEVYSSLRKAMNDNTVNAWKLNSKLRLYYGLADYWVPAPIGEQTAADFNAIDGNSEYFSYEALSGKNHETALIPMISGTFDWFLSF